MGVEQVLKPELKVLYLMYVAKRPLDVKGVAIRLNIKPEIAGQKLEEFTNQGLLKRTEVGQIKKYEMLDEGRDYVKENYGDFNNPNEMNRRYGKIG